MPTRKTSSSKKSSAKGARKTTAKKVANRKTSSAKKRIAASKTSKRTLIEPHKGDRRFVRRSKGGEFTTDQVDVGRSLAADRRRTSKRTVAKGQGDRGDTAKKGIIAKIFG
jgi:hypothetical protein